MEATKPDENRLNLLAVSLPSPTLACLRARPKSPLRRLLRPHLRPLWLEFLEMRFAHPKKMPVKKYPYAPTLVYFADQHLWHRQRRRGTGVFSPSPPTKIWRGHAKRPDALVLKNTFTDVFDIGDFRAHISCPQTTQELPKKHHEAGAHLMGSYMKLDRRNNCLLTHCHKSITDKIDSKDCKEVSR